MSDSIPNLAAMTPTPRRPEDDDAFGFETPTSSQLDWLSPLKGTHNSRSSMEVLPQHYGKPERLTPAAKLGMTLRKIGTTMASPFHPTATKSRPLENDGVIHSVKQKPSPSKKNTAVAVSLILGCGGLLYVLMNHRQLTASSNKEPKLFKFRPTPVPRSPSAKAVDVFREAYGTNAGGGLGVHDPLNPGTVFVLLEQETLEHMEEKQRGILTDESNPAYGKVRDFALGYEKFLVEQLTREWGDKGFGASKDEEDSEQQDKLVEVTSYYSLKDENLPHIADAHYATPNGRTALIEIRFSVPPGVVAAEAKEPTMIQDYTKSVLEAIFEYMVFKDPEHVELAYTGLPLLQQDLLKMQSQRTSMGALHQMLPASHPSLVSYRYLAERFGWGRISPYKIVFDGREAGLFVDATKGFKMMQNVMEAMIEQVDTKVETSEEAMNEDLEMMSGISAVNLDSVPQRVEDGHMKEHLDEVIDELYGKIGADEVWDPKREALKEVFYKPHTRTTYDGIAFVQNNVVPYPLFLGSTICENNNEPHCPIELMRLFVKMEADATTRDRMTTYVTATLGVDPFSEDGLAWLKAARAKLDDLRRLNGGLGGYKVYIEGGASLEYDVEQEHVQDLTSMSLEVWGALFLLFGLFVGFVAAPLKSKLLSQGSDGHYDKLV